jgi:hypothetical protein
MGEMVLLTCLLDKNIESVSVRWLVVTGHCYWLYDTWKHIQD